MSHFVVTLVNEVVSCLVEALKRIDVEVSPRHLSLLGEQLKSRPQCWPKFIAKQVNEVQQLFPIIACVLDDQAP